MRIFPWTGPCLALTLLGLLSFPCGAFSEQEEPVDEKERRVLAILDPIDLHTQRADPEWGEFLRKSFASNPGRKVLSRDSARAKFEEYLLDSRVPCHEFQCAFDAGNILSAEFVLFASVTGLDEL